MRIVKLVLSIFLVISFRLVEAQEQSVGVFINDERASEGYTLFTNSRTTYLIDNCGREVNRWVSTYRPGLSVYLLENGNLLRSGRASGSFSGGGVGGVFELYNWEGELLWSYIMADDVRQSHHDIEPLPNGNFLALVWTELTSLETSERGRITNQPVWMENIYEIKMKGSDDIDIVWEWKMEDHLIQEENTNLLNYGIVADHPERMNFNFEVGTDKDWAHFNAIDYNEDLDQIAISARSFNEIWILDHSTTTEEAATSEGGESGKGGDILYRYGNPQAYNRGTEDDQVFFSQHNIEWIDQGSFIGELSVFNNIYDLGVSRVERFIPPLQDGTYQLEEGSAYGPTEVEWAYEEEGFFSSRISGAQFLANDNVLICQGNSGRFFEITQGGEVVWEYFNPVSGIGGPVVQGEIPFQVATFRALKYSPDYPALDGKDLTPGDPIEIDPIPSDCIPTITSVNADISQGLQIDKSIVSDNIRVQISIASHITVMDAMGVVHKNLQLTAGEHVLDFGSFASGFYFLTDGVSTFRLFKY